MNFRRKRGCHFWLRGIPIWLSGKEPAFLQQRIISEKDRNVVNFHCQLRLLDHQWKREILSIRSLSHLKMQKFCNHWEKWGHSPWDISPQTGEVPSLTWCHHGCVEKPEVCGWTAQYLWTTRPHPKYIHGPPLPLVKPYTSHPGLGGGSLGRGVFPWLQPGKSIFKFLCLSSKYIKMVIVTEKIWI